MLHKVRRLLWALNGYAEVASQCPLSLDERSWLKHDRWANEFGCPATGAGLPRPRRAAQRLRRLGGGAGESGAAPLRVAETRATARRARSPRWRIARAAAPPQFVAAPPPSTAWCRFPR